MPRGPRPDAPGSYHHVVLRGVERRAIFLDDSDRTDLVRRLERLVPELDFECLAFAFIPNHVHLLLRRRSVRLSTLMARVGTGYSGRFNRRHGRVGHLFQNRFRSRIVDSDADLRGVAAYVLRNPLKHGIVSDPSAVERFRWCTASALFGYRQAFGFESIDRLREVFGAGGASARASIRAALARPTPVHGWEGRTHSEAIDDESLGRYLRAWAIAIGVSLAELGSSGRERRLVSARKLLVRRAISELGASQKQIARVAGLSASTVSRAAQVEDPPLGGLRD